MSDIESLQKRIKELEKKNASLAQELSVKMKKYGLYWLDCPEAFDEESENKIPVLEEVPDKEIRNDDGKPTHILIEGDNYHALTCLNFTHRGKIDVIYIDPPYNTGEDFTYCDKRFLDEYPNGELIRKDHPLRHSAWLSFMSKRLKLAKQLLRNTGVIFISINEDEYANLRLLCDRIFDEKNYVATFTVRVRHEDRILKGDKPIHEVTEFLLMYQRSAAFRIQKRKVDNSDPSEYRYVIKELSKNPRTQMMGGKKVWIFRPGQYEIAEVPPSFKNLKKINIRGTIKRGNSSGRFHMAHLEPLKNEFNVLYKVEDIGDDGLGYRYFLSREDADRANGFYFQGEPLEREDVREIPYPNFIDLEEEFNAVGTEGGVPFDGGKKPITFINRIMMIAGVAEKRDAVVLDFFAGSGSTLHAICKMNGDGGKRAAIVVQSADRTYEIKNGIERARKGCENAFNGGFRHIVEITLKRAKNIIQGYKVTGSVRAELFSEKLTVKRLKDGCSMVEDASHVVQENKGKYDSVKIEIKKDELIVTGTLSKKTTVPGFGGSLKYYKTAFVGKHGSNDALDEDRDELAANAGTMLALAEGTLDAVSVPKKADGYWCHYSDGLHKHTLVYYSCRSKELPSLSKEADRIRAKDKDAKLSIYVYTVGGCAEAYDTEFDDMRNITLKAIPEPILDIYRTVNGD